MTAEENHRAAFLRAFNVSRETTERLDQYAALLEKWNPAINLVAPSTLKSLWQRHFMDSAQILDLAPKTTRTWVDLGTGGGFPGLIVAILAAEKRPMIRVTCVESDLRKATFLRTVLRETGVDGTVVSKRIEETLPLGADVVSSRALAPLPNLLGLTVRHLAPTGCALLQKGEGYKKEVAEALDKWSFTMEVFPSKTSVNAVTLKLGDIQSV